LRQQSVEEHGSATDRTDRLVSICLGLCHLPRRFRSLAHGSLDPKPEFASRSIWSSQPATAPNGTCAFRRHGRRARKSGDSVRTKEYSRHVGHHEFYTGHAWALQSIKRARTWSYGTRLSGKGSDDPAFRGHQDHETRPDRWRREATRLQVTLFPRSRIHRTSLPPQHRDHL